ncbi:phage protease [Lichenibacterium ramalinae]|uniref:Mu-like prophage I protein n=1 Tax=Lichenibacterium ramalinae TaxID=2316527 RepID=A0A4Q2R6M7_9HYPH|nr:phage protease [Lichenibacterium ramalinae]RYB02032.1 hypothetical protein D3272_22970 [Lichenibacterium ramalinae]
MNNPNAADFLRSLNITSTLASELPIQTGDTAQTAPEWIKATPKGHVTTRDGRGFTFDPARLAARFATDKVQIPVDLDHSTILLGARGETPKTVGYASAVEARDDGTYVRVGWNAAGLAALAAGTHRYVSPTIHTDDAGHATWLHSVALVSAPALGDMPALMAAMGLGGGGVPAQLAGVAGALGLSATADEAAILAAIGGMVPKATHEATLAALTETTGRLSALSATTRKADVERLVDDAVREMKIVPAQRPIYLAMCATEAGVGNFRELMAATTPMLQPSGLDGKVPPQDHGPQAVQEIIDAARLHVAEKAQLGILVTMPEAINAVAKRSAV